MSILLGHNRDTGDPIRLSEQSRVDHVLVLGKTRTGKTTLLENMIRQDIDAGNGVLVLEPHGTLYDNILAYCHVNTRHLKRLHLINPNEEDYRIGINYFDLPGFDPDTKSQFVLDGLYKAFGQSTDEAKVLLERWGMASLSALEPLGLTLAELYYFLQDKKFREVVLSKVDDDILRREWERYELAPLRDQEFYSMAIFNRAIKFVRGKRTRYIFGQPNSIDWLKVMNEGGIVLVNLLPKPASRDLTKVVGISLLHQIYANAKLRPKNDPQAKPFYVYVDEFSQLMTEDYANSMNELAGFGIHFVLAQQNINDLKKADEHEILFNSVLNNTDTKIVFRLANYNEASEMAKHLFAPQITGDEIKATSTHAIPHVHNETSTSVSDSSSSHSGWSELITPGGLENQHGYAHGTADQHAVSYHDAQKIEYTYEEIPTFRSLEESFHNYASKIMAQRVGEAYILSDPKLPPRALKTMKPKQYFVCQKFLAQTKERIFSRMALRSPAQVKELLSTRMTKLIEARETEFEEYDGDDITPENPTDPKNP